MNDNEVLFEMLNLVGRILQESQEAPRDNEGYLAWANEIIPVLPGVKMRRCVYHVNIVGPAMAFVRRGRLNRGEDVDNDPTWQQMVEASVVTAVLVSMYDQQGKEVDFVGWVMEMASLDAPIFYDSGSDWQLHTEYHGLDTRLPEEVAADATLPVYVSTLCDGDGEPILEVPSRFSASREEAHEVHKAWVKELRGE
jgi:hypothetical protein